MGGVTIDQLDVGMTDLKRRYTRVNLDPGQMTEVGRCRGMIDVPDTSLDSRIECFQSFLAASADLDEGVQEALNDCDGGKKRQPDVLGCLPTVSVDRFGCIVGCDVVSFFLESAIGLCQCDFTCIQCQGRSQYAITADRRGDVAFLAVEMDMLFS